MKPSRDSSAPADLLLSRLWVSVGMGGAFEEDGTGGGRGQ